MDSQEGKQLYHYTMCGLDNIYLANGFEIHDTDYGSGISITDIDGLHRAIAKGIIYNGAKPSGKEIRFLRKELDLSQSGLASFMGVDSQTVARWEKKETEIPGPAANLMRFLIEDLVTENELLRKAIQDLTELDEIVNKDKTFHATDAGWKTAA
jgi:putative transcriptional regulator